MGAWRSPIEDLGHFISLAATVAGVQNLECHRRDAQPVATRPEVLGFALKPRCSDDFRECGWIKKALKRRAREKLGA